MRGSVLVREYDRSIRLPFLFNLRVFADMVARRQFREKDDEICRSRVFGTGRVRAYMSSMLDIPALAYEGGEQVCSRSPTQR